MLLKITKYNLKFVSALEKREDGQESRRKIIWKVINDWIGWKKYCQTERSIFFVISGFGFILFTVQMIWNGLNMQNAKAIGISMVWRWRKRFSFWAFDYTAAVVVACLSTIRGTDDALSRLALPFMMDFFSLCVCTRWFSTASHSFLAPQSIFPFDCNCILCVRVYCSYVLWC